MVLYLYLKSGKYYELVPQIRLTRSKNGTTGTAVFEINLGDIKVTYDVFDPIYGVALKKKESFRMADICNFIWSSGKPIKLVAIFIFSNTYEKQDFFNYYPYYAITNSLEFFPAPGEENFLNY